MIRLSPALLLAALVAACDNDPPTTPGSIDLDATLAQMASGGIASYSTAATSTPVGSVAVASPSSSASSCPYNAATQFFVCTPVTANGLTFSRQYQLLDASGAALSTPNPLVVASIRSVMDLEGTTTQGTAPNVMTIQIDRHEDATLTGIQSTNRVLNGTATQQMSMTGSSFLMTINDVSTTTNLQLPSSPEQRYPLGGKIVTDGTLTSSGVTTSSQQYHREILFDGTSVMTVIMTTGSSTLTCKINLAAPGTPPTCS